jgi:hypothetical protein
MNRLFTFSALAALGLGLTACMPALAQTFEEREDGTVISRDVRALTPEVSRNLKLARTPMPPSPLIVGTYWSCRKHSSGHEICRIKLVVCTEDQQNCVEV